jgi:CRP-like cAMP-binding protein
MKNINTLTYISNKAAKIILKESSSRVFSPGSSLFYEGHVPIVAFYIHKGEVNIIRKKKVLETITTGTLIGAHELLNNLPSSFEAKTKESSTIYFLDKSTLSEIQDRENCLLKNEIVDKAI